MNIGGGTAGYDELTGGDGGGEASTGAAQVSPAAVPELKSLLSLAVGAAVIAALYLAGRC